MSMIDARNGIIAGFIMLAFGAVLALKGILTGVKMRKVAAAYATTQALVTKRRESKTYTGDRLADDRSVTTFMVELEYIVEGKTHKIRRKSRRNLSQGSTTVYYDPANPAKAYTEEQVLGGYFASRYVLAGIVGGLGLAVIIYVLTQMGEPALPG